MKILLAIVSFILLQYQAQSQHVLDNEESAQKWVDSVYNTLSLKQKIAQTFIIRAHSNLGEKHELEIKKYIKKYGIGGLCFFQGGPIRQAILTNQYQKISKVPLLISIDAEWGLGMRLDSVIPLPKLMMLSATNDTNLVKQYAAVIANQCKLMGIQINYAPVVDVNNNSLNPVINDRSFGENKNKVALFGSIFTKEFQKHGLIACVKHFPGHGDVQVDSHFDLPIVNKSLQQLQQLELVPFQEQIKSQVAMVMNAHLSIPSLDTTTNLPTSLSYASVNNLLKNTLHFKGLAITDGMEMKGISKYYKPEEASMLAIKAGNDLLCLPGNIKGSIKKIKRAIKKNEINNKTFEQSVKKILLAKYHTCLGNILVDTSNLINRLNENTEKLNQTIADKALTSIANLTSEKKCDIYLSVNCTDTNQLYFSELKNNGIQVIHVTDSNQFQLYHIQSLFNSYKNIVLAIHQMNRKASENYAIKNWQIELINNIKSKSNICLAILGNPYALNLFPDFKNAIITYDETNYTKNSLLNWIIGKLKAQGQIPVSVKQLSSQ